MATIKSKTSGILSEKAANDLINVLKEASMWIKVIQHFAKKKKNYCL